ncbi:MAG: A/G-specific adenine glycosylase [Muribaculaceae bacterium]|nr:A/G-specific adenine glycosylase [Muribaculaceae bacterium]
MNRHPFTRTILKWFAAHGRELPWRGVNDPYAIWLSEVILQQTRIAQGTDYWTRFMQAFPTVQDLAAASQDQVMLLWQGLGYYSRARHLHEAARQIVAMGHFPNTLEKLRSLKGVGDYTAAAIGSMAFGLPVAAVDGNVFRVLARHFGLNTPINTTQGKRQFTDLAQRLLPADMPGTFNQALMDFGALQCTPTSPHCFDCPLADTCQAHAQGTTAQLPVKQKTIKRLTRHFTYVYLRCKGFTAIRQRPAGDIWQGLWEPYLIEEGSLPQWEGQYTLIKQGVKHVLTHRTIMADFYLFECVKHPQLPPQYIWINESDMGNYALPRLVERLLESFDY